VPHYHISEQDGDVFLDLGDDLTVKGVLRVLKRRAKEG
jgi:hypothetical protein